jgi:hypothetical protein
VWDLNIHVHVKFQCSLKKWFCDTV